MFKNLVVLSLSICALLQVSFIRADDCCCRALEFDLGWRQDSLDWNVKDIHPQYHRKGKANSHILFKGIDSYTLSAKAKWADTDYYIRASAEYGSTFKGNAKEHFRIDSPVLYYPIFAHNENPVKRRSEVYDFNIAAGYPFTFLDCRLTVIPLVGFSYHRQRLRVKRDNPCSDSSSDFYLDYSYNAFYSDLSSNPFEESSSESDIPYYFGLYNEHRTDSYRFTWYGFYLGADIAYALDCCWTLFAELEGHFFDRCHRKRKSWTGVESVDHYHKEEWAYGFNGVFGLTYSFATCWYTDLSVDFDWWSSNGKHDKLEWKKTGIKIGTGYTF